MRVLGRRRCIETATYTAKRRVHGQEGSSAGLRCCSSMIKGCATYDGTQPPQSHTCLSLARLLLTLRSTTHFFTHPCPTPSSPFLHHRAYDRLALLIKGSDAETNFPASQYEQDPLYCFVRQLSNKRAMIMAVRATQEMKEVRGADLLQGT